MRQDIFLTLCIVLLCVGYYAGEGLCKTQGNEAIPEKIPRLTVPESFYSFGKIYRGDRVRHNFILKNTGEAELEIKKVRASCGCTAAEPSQKVVPPGGEAYVEVTFDSQNFVGRVTKTVLVDTNDTSEPTHTLTLEAIVLEEVVAEPTRLTLGLIRQGEGRNLKVEVRSPTGIELKVSKAQSSSRALEVTSIEEQAGGTYVIRLEVRKDSPTGRFDGDLVVHTGSQRQPIITIPFFGEVVSDVSVFPPRLSFGLVRKGMEVMRQILVTLHSPEVRLVKVEVEVTGPPPSEVFSLREYQQDGGGAYRMDVVLSRETMPGRLEGNLKIHTTSISQPLITVPISATVKE